MRIKETIPQVVETSSLDAGDIHDLIGLPMDEALAHLDYALRRSRGTPDFDAVVEFSRQVREQYRDAGGELPPILLSSRCTRL
jgi:hypothetical protein